MWSEGVQWVWAGSSEAPFHKSPQPAVIGLHIPPRITTHPLFVFRKKILKHLLWLPELLTVMCQNKLRFHFTSHWMQLLKWWFFSLVRFLQHLLLQAATFPFLPASVFMIYLQLSSPITRWNKHLQNTSFGLVLAALLCMKCVISWENNRSGTFFSLFAKWSGHFWKRAALRKQDGTFRVPSEMAQCFVPNETARSFDRFDCPLIKTGEVARLVRLLERVCRSHPPLFAWSSFTFPELWSVNGRGRFIRRVCHLPVRHGLSGQSWRSDCPRALGDPAGLFASPTNAPLGDGGWWRVSVAAHR